MTDPARIRLLMVEDDPDSARGVQESLREIEGIDWEVTHLPGIVEAREKIGNESFDAILLDLSLPGMAGVEPVATLYEVAPHIPIIALAENDGESIAIQAVQAGAQDSLVKNRANGRLIAHSVRYSIERKRLDNEHALLRERLEAEHARVRFLADAGMVLASSLDYEETLTRTAGLAVEAVADFCVIDIIDEEGEIHRLAVSHADPGRAELARELKRFPLDRSRPNLAFTVIETGHSALADINDEVLRSLTQDEEHFRILHELAPISYMAVPLIARDRLLGVLTFMSSSRHFATSDLNLAEELARRAALAVDDARLYQQAQNVIRARDEVLRVVSHDLRNPLSTITMSAQILLDPEIGLTEEQRLRQLQVIIRSSARMDRLIQDLLDISRLEAGQLALDLHLHNAERLLREAAELHSSQAIPKHLTLEYRAEENLPAVLVDRDKILQVLANLIGNAIKFTPENGSITMAVEPMDGQLRFVVSDTGPGVPPQQLDDLFRPFWQGRRGGRDGAGLGLAISKGIVEKHGGSIWAESAEGSGMRVYFTLPAAEERRSVPATAR